MEKPQHPWHWGHLGLTPGAVLTWTDRRTQVLVASGNGRRDTPCGTLVGWGEGLANLRFVTRALLAVADRDPDLDPLDLWSVDGVLLRDLKNTSVGGDRRENKEG